MIKHPPRPPHKPRPTEEGRWLTEMRRRYSKRQSDIAELYHIHPGRIAEWETGQHPIPPDVMKSLHDYFDGLELSVSSV